MSIIEKLPWYNDFTLVLERKRIAEKDIEEIENPENQLLRIKKFYKNLGADYSKNIWIKQVEENNITSDDEEDSRIKQLKREVEFANILECAVLRQDNESISALIIYKDNALYKQIVRKVMFYIGVSKVKEEPEFIKKAYDGVYKNYPLDRASLFSNEGVYYYIYYFKCLHKLIIKYNGMVSYEEIKNQIKDRCYNAKLMLSNYLKDMYLMNEVQLIMTEIRAVEELL